MKYLITYLAVKPEKQSWGWGYTIEDDPVRWLEKAQNFSETYFLINSQPVTDEWAEKWDGVLKGT